ncbi:transcriptional regulatory protein, C-terminal domain protein [Bacteriovorax sp. BSW11_IV]|uniref:winged helix-turn-helix domain-containing protein n=1 Tax=Bacteriovorax sp. BSW11_IV TaxID=1353529 RepID=UPI00038A3C2C|nr:helix-turn-helix domain-containing protein [Bacteriovorax sp. BSW11_IV]EQC49320.1 transcriptional regulatory protein, C-terminal domain protein [Bacteriovorax sp. BSW11_IV]
MHETSSINTEATIGTLAFLANKESLIPPQEAVNDLEVGRSYYQLGKIYYDKADLTNAEVNFIKALSLATEPRDTYSMFKIYGFLIRIASEKLENHKAKTYIQQAEILVENLATVLGSLHAEYFYNVGIVKNYSGDFITARENYELACKKAREENEPDLLAKCLLALAQNAFHRNSLNESLVYLKQLSDLLEIVDKSYLRGAMYNLFAKVFVEIGDSNKALDYLTLANNTLQDKKCWNLHGYILLLKGKAYKLSGDFSRALLYFELSKEVNDPKVFKRLEQLILSEIEDVNDASVDLYLDKTNRLIKERHLGIIDFKHRFVLLEILFLLSKNAGTYYDKEQLAKAIWKDEYNPLIHDKLIYTSVSRLRKLIEPKGETDDKRKYIIRGKDGYTFNPLVKIRFHMEAKSHPEAPIANVDLASPV